MKKNKEDKNKKDKGYCFSVEDLQNKYGNKYAAILKIVDEAKRISEIKGDSSNNSDIVMKLFKDLIEVVIIVI